ncbi:MAG TPA: hypothetical protein VGP77_16465 [Vicinamibacterales bacterium]|nr:hypothetical protein [Vicinamibacterales bacterium]
MQQALYSRLQWVALLPLATFVWTGLADVSLGWAGTLPLSIDFNTEPGKVWSMLSATLIETVVPIGLLIGRTRALSALVLSVYVLIAGVNAYWTSEHLDVQPLARIIAVSGALLFVFAATQALRERDRDAAKLSGG